MAEIARVVVRQDRGRPKDGHVLFRDYPLKSVPSARGDAPIPSGDDLRKATEREDVKFADCETGRLRVGRAGLLVDDGGKLGSV